MSFCLFLAGKAHDAGVAPRLSSLVSTAVIATAIAAVWIGTGAIWTAGACVAVAGIAAAAWKESALGREATLALVCAAGAAAAALAMPDGETPLWMFIPVLVVLVHLYALQVGAGSVRAHAFVMLLLAGFLAGTVEAGFRALYADAAPAVEPPSAPPASPADQRGRYLAGLIPPGAFRGYPPGWSVPIGRVRGTTPPYEKPAGVFRVLAMGSSSTEGFELAGNEETWPGALGIVLDASAGPGRYEVINAGVGGMTTFQMILNFRKEMVRYDPDLLILYVAGNDQLYTLGPFTARQIFELSGHKDVRETLRPPSASVAAMSPANAAAVRLQRVLSRFYVYRLLRRPIVDARRMQEESGAFNLSVTGFRAVPPEDFTANLEAFAETCADRGIRLWLVGEGSRMNLSPYKS
ncbi:MAG: GDSL-type esterase/lipase family protein [Deltaproteobacteria bacterium]|nr:GDSL-type esterase/lipase family protein [Deltaproteobacteria bacterium]